MMYGTYDLWKLASPNEPEEEDGNAAYPAYAVVIRNQWWASTYADIDRAIDEWRGFACKPCLDANEPKSDSRCCRVEWVE